MKGLFVTGTDTGVGKTVVSAGLAGVLRKRGFDVGVSKPVCTGAVRRNGKLISTDALFLKRVSGVDDSPEEICPLCFEMPAAPNVAARAEGRAVELKRLRHALSELSERHTALLVEGIGGFRVPITAGFSVRELAVELGLPVLVVARAGLGTINHSTLTVESVRSAGLRVAGVVLVESHPEVDPSRASNAEEIEKLTGVDVLGVVPFASGLSVEDGTPGELMALVEEQLDVARILRVINEEDRG